MIIEFEGKVSDEHRVKWQRLAIHCVWPLVLFSFISNCINNEPYHGLINFTLLGFYICLFSAMREDILWYKLYRIMKELKKC